MITESRFYGSFIKIMEEKKSFLEELLSDQTRSDRFSRFAENCLIISVAVAILSVTVAFLVVFFL